jgi:hypothetical protein
MIRGWGSTQKQLDELKQRVMALEARAGIQTYPTVSLESSLPFNPMADDPSYLPAAGQPWVSKRVQISEQLTSFEFAVKAQFGQAAIFALGGAVLGGLLGGWLDLSWYVAPVIGVVSGTIALIILVLDHRGMVHQLVNEVGQRPAKKQELRIAIKHSPSMGNQSDLRFLYLNGAIDRDDLRLMAQGVNEGKSLAVNAWIGVGGWTRTKVDNVMSELEKMGYVRPGRGNQPRQLTRRGRALFKALAE